MGDEFTGSDGKEGHSQDGKNRTSFSGVPSAKDTTALGFLCLGGKLYSVHSFILPSALTQHLRKEHTHSRNAV